MCKAIVSLFFIIIYWVVGVELFLCAFVFLCLYFVFSKRSFGRFKVRGIRGVSNRYVVWFSSACITLFLCLYFSIDSLFFNFYEHVGIGRFSIYSEEEGGRYNLYLFGVIEFYIITLALFYTVFAVFDLCFSRDFYSSIIYPDSTCYPFLGDVIKVFMRGFVLSGFLFLGCYYSPFVFEDKIVSDSVFDKFFCGIFICNFYLLVFSETHINVFNFVVAFNKFLNRQENKG